MNRGLNTFSFNPTAWAGVSVTLLVALFFGAVAAIFPWWMSVGVAIGLPVLFFMVARPFWGLVLTMAFTFRVVPYVLAPDIPLGGFKLHMSELCLFATGAGAFLRYLRPHAGEAYGADHLRTVIRATKMMILVIFVSVIYSKFSGINFTKIVSESRNYVALLAIPMVPYLVDDQRAWRRLIQALFVMACVISIYVLIQLSTGMNIMGARVEDLGLSENTGVTRSLLVGGGYVIGFCLYYGYGLVRANRSHLTWFTPVAMLLILGIVGTFTRSTWLTITVGALFVAWLHGGFSAILGMSLVGGLVLSMALGAGFMVKPVAVQAAIDRATGITTEISSGASFGWRLRENQFALDSIAKRPLVGVGLGAPYRRLDLAPDAFEGSESFIHNGYLLFPVKMGLAGCLFLGTLLLTFVRSAARGRHDTSFESELRRKAFLGVSLSFLFGAINAPVFSTFHGILFIAIMIAGVLPLQSRSAPNGWASVKD